jgi:predicted Fe-Mo cluster-binding NifX family protein
MASNVTTGKVYTEQREYTDPCTYYPLLGGSTPSQYVEGEMIGLIASGAHAGFATHFDDSQTLTFLGTNTSQTQLVNVLSTDADGKKRVRVKRAYQFLVQMQGSETVNNTQIGDPAYAMNNATVTMVKANTTFANVAGYLSEIHLPGTSPDAITGGTWAWLTPPPGSHLVGAGPGSA